ncbi:hypothetical protein COOONC_22171 [Cooperia oncophora]
MKARLRFEGLRLLCNRESLLHTRNVLQKVVDSKRCSSMGSCIGNKCGDINETSLLPELMIGNSFPGITSCVESCGGPGCGCFHWDSGCLFYRMYGVPKDDPSIKELHYKSYVLVFCPNVLVPIQNFEMTLSVRSVPPIPILEQNFIRSKHHAAVWNREKRRSSTVHRVSMPCG